MLKDNTNGKQLNKATSNSNNSWNKSIGVSKKSILGGLVKTKLPTPEIEEKVNPSKTIQSEVKSNALSLLGAYTDSENEDSS